MRPERIVAAGRTIVVRTCILRRCRIAIFNICRRWSWHRRDILHGRQDCIDCLDATRVSTLGRMQKIDQRNVVYLMRGLPGCGKSHRARRLAGADGIVLETDEYFYTQVGTDPASYDYSKHLLPEARRWNLVRLKNALVAGVSPIVVDRGNGLNAESREFAALAVEHGYHVELAEPDSPWWQELRVLLKYKEFVADKLFDVWAHKLAQSTREGHRVPASDIRHWMKHWRHDLTVEQILKSLD